VTKTAGRYKRRCLQAAAGQLGNGLSAQVPVSSNSVRALPDPGALGIQVNDSHSVPISVGNCTSTRQILHRVESPMDEFHSIADALAASKVRVNTLEAYSNLTRGALQGGKSDSECAKGGVIERSVLA
jgi:hypothetical protein